MKTILRRLQGGGAVCLFPEATRTSDGKVASIKAGFGFLARRSDAVIVPIIIDGAYECWPRHKKIFSFGRITVRYGKPILAEKIAKSDDEQLAASITDVLRTMQGAVRLESGKQPYEY